MRVKIIGDTESARVLRGYLQKAGVAVSDHLPKFALSCTIHLSEHSGQNIICDSIDCPLEMHILRHITELTEKDVVLRRRTGVISTENEIHLSVPTGDPESAHAVEVGVLRGVQRAHFHRPWWRRVLPTVLLVSLLAPTAWSFPRHATPQPELTAETSGGVIHISMPPGGIFPQFQTGGGTSPCSGATAPAHTFCGNNTGSVAAPAYVSLTAADLPASITSNTSGLAATATAFAATPSTCGAGVAAIGVLANGNATGCFTPGGLANPMTTLGDMIYGASSGTPTRIGPNTTATGQFLYSVSSLAPVWRAPVIADIGTGTSTANYTFSGTVTAANVDNVIWLDDAKYSTLAAALAATPAGGVLMCRPNHSETISSTVTISASVWMRLTGCTFTSTVNPVLTVSANNVRITGGTINLNGANASCLEPIGTVTNMTVEYMTCTGDGNQTGTLAVTNGNTTVTGTGTNFPSSLAGGKLNILQSGTVTTATVLTVNSGTSITLTAGYGGATQSGITSWTMNNGQQGFWEPSGQTLTGMKYLNNRLSFLIVGISNNADGAGILEDILIQGNTITDILGSETGSGYAIHFNSGNTQNINGVTQYIPTDTRIIGNSTARVMRHDYYVAKGAGVTFIGNVSRNHRPNFQLGAPRPPYQISRASDVTVTNNIALDPNDGCYDVDTDAASAIPPHNIVFTANICRNPSGSAAFTVGTQNPAVDGILTAVVISDNVVWMDETVAGPATPVLIQSGKQIYIVANRIQYLNTGGTRVMISITGTGETAGTSTYTDDVQTRDNVISCSGAGTCYGFEINTAAATSGITAQFFNNRLNGANGGTFFFDATQTDPNITLFGNPPTGNANLVPRLLVPLPVTAMTFLEQAAPSGSALNAVLYADTTTHGLKASYNNGAFFSIPLVGIANTWTANQTQGANTAIILTEGTSSGAAAGADACYGDSTDHVIECAFNNGAFRPLAPLVLFVTGDFTTAANTNLQTITGLSWTVPARANKMNVACSLAYHQNTAAVADNWGIQAATNNPTNIFATYDAQTAATAYAGGVLATLATTTATNIGGTFTPSAITTDWTAKVNALIENAASANTFNIMIKTSTAADALVVKRGSTCTVTFQ